MLPRPRTRPTSEALYRVEVKVGQRSQGRSAVAAAAYRAGTKLTDARTGRTFDYSRKDGITATFIAAPANAPAWVYDRAELWSRVELAEKHPRAVTFREVLVSVPREIPPEEREAFIRRAVEPYVAAGAVADVALHAPSAADGDEQPHAHVLLTPRALDASRETGLAKNKNTTLEAMFESGGRHGGAPGDALRRERQRWAEEINSALRAVGSVARADHRSRRERGLDDAPEPTVGERDTARWRRQRDAGEPPQPSRRQQHVGAVRARRRLETFALETEVEMAKTAKVPYKANKQEVKTELLRRRLPGLPAEAAAGAYMVDVQKPDVTRVQFRDDSWVEIDHKGGAVRHWGGPKGEGAAKGFAGAAADSLGWERDTVEWLPPALRSGRGPAQAPTPEQTHSLAERWRERGYTDVVEGHDGAWVSLGRSRLHDTGNRVTIHGPASEDALRALCHKARDEWRGHMEIRGPEDFLQRAWLEAQRQGVVVTNYEPPERVRRAWEREQAKTATVRAAVERVEDKAATARAALAYLRGESEDPPSPEIGAYIDSLPKADQSRFAGREPYELVPEVQEWQRRGATLAAEDQPAAGPAAPKPSGPRRPQDAEEDDGPQPPDGPPPPAPGSP